MTVGMTLPCLRQMRTSLAGIGARSSSRRWCPPSGAAPAPASGVKRPLSANAMMMWLPVCCSASFSRSGWSVAGPQHVRSPCTAVDLRTRRVPGESCAINMLVANSRACSLTVRKYCTCGICSCILRVISDIVKAWHSGRRGRRQTLRQGSPPMKCLTFVVIRGPSQLGQAQPS